MPVNFNKVAPKGIAQIRDFDSISVSKRMIGSHISGSESFIFRQNVVDTSKIRKKVIALFLYSSS